MRTTFGTALGELGAWRVSTFTDLGYSGTAFNVRRSNKGRGFKYEAGKKKESGVGDFR